MQQSSFPVKIEVNYDSQDIKVRQNLYKTIHIEPDDDLQKKEFQVIQHPTYRIYCENCSLQITRSFIVITESTYYCVGCFANMDEKNLSYTFTQTSWNAMDQILMLTGFGLLGFGNWSQIKDFMDYNGSPFSIEEMQHHYDTYYLANEDSNIKISQVIEQALPKQSIGLLMQKYYSVDKSKEEKKRKLEHKNSTGQKKPSNEAISLSILPSSMDIEAKQNQPLNDDDKSISEQIIQSEHIDSFSRKQPKVGFTNDCGIIGYNPKRKEFQVIQYDYKAESMLAELAFNSTDTPQEIQLKLDIIAAYNKRLDQRLIRRDFVLEHKLLNSHFQFCQKNKISNKVNNIFQPFMRFYPNHQQYLKLIDSYEICKKQQNIIKGITKLRQKIDKSGKIEKGFEYLERKKIKLQEKRNSDNSHKVFKHQKPRKIFHYDGFSKFYLYEVRQSKKQKEQTVMPPITIQQKSEIEQMLKLSNSFTISQSKIITLLTQNKDSSNILMDQQ